jgi:hypothetical protein
MNDVVTSVKRVTDIIGEIADASAEQTAGIEQVNLAIAAMDQATQQNAALVEESAAAAATMREQAGTLTRMIGAFLLGTEPGAKPAAQVHLISNHPVNATARRTSAAKPGAHARSPAPGPQPATSRRAAAPAGAHRPSPTSIGKSSNWGQSRFIWKFLFPSNWGQSRII